MKESLHFMEAVKICLSKYATLNGRARRSEYWWWFLAVMIVSCVIGWIPILGWLICLALAIPSITVGVRRLHDLNKSGWLYLLCLVPVVGGLLLLYWFSLPGTVGANQYGEDPKQ